jgi:hypothetical protein
MKRSVGTLSAVVLALAGVLSIALAKPDPKDKATFRIGAGAQSPDKPHKPKDPPKAIAYLCTFDKRYLEPIDDKETHIDAAFHLLGETGTAVYMENDKLVFQELQYVGDTTLPPSLKCWAYQEKKRPEKTWCFPQKEVTTPGSTSKYFDLYWVDFTKDQPKANRFSWSTTVPLPQQ